MNSTIEKITEAISDIDSSDILKNYNLHKEYIGLFESFIQQEANNLKDYHWVLLKYASFLVKINFVNTSKIEELYNIIIKNKYDGLNYAYIGLLELYSSRYEFIKYHQTLEQYRDINPSDPSIDSVDDTFYNKIINSIAQQYISKDMVSSLYDYLSKTSCKTIKQESLYELLYCYINDNHKDKNNILNIIAPHRRYRFTEFEHTDQEYGILYCANNDYIKPMLVSMFSLIVNNQHILSSLNFILGLSSDITQSNKDIIAKFCIKLGIKYNIINMSNEFISKYKTTYGKNNSNARSKLDISAYYRMFVLKYLYINKIYQKQVLYLDCDTIIVNSLFHMFEKYNRFPLYAYEDDKINGDIINSKHTNNLEFYFNSGVMLFNLDDLCFECLQNSIDTLKQYHRIFFHDQCALNIGFNNHWQRIPSTYNYMLNRHKLESNNMATIIHFCSPVKVWDNAYSEQELASKLWYGYYNMMRLIIK